MLCDCTAIDAGYAYGYFLWISLAQLCQYNTIYKMNQYMNFIHLSTQGFGVCALGCDFT